MRHHHLFGVVRRAAPGLALLLLTACSSSAPARTVEPAGFIEPGQLVADERYPGALVHVVPGVSLAGYEALLLEPVVPWIVAGKATDEEPEEPALLERFAAEFDALLRARLSERFKLAEAPGGAVVKLRVAVTEVARRIIVSRPAFRRGAAGVEWELLDPAGKRLFAGCARRLGRRAASALAGEPGHEDARLIMEDWAHGLLDWLQQAGLPVRPGG